jgi:predicted nucleic acid-binding protein
VIVLDTNVVSELLRATPSPELSGWLDRLPSSAAYITAITAGELHYGAVRLPAGRRRDRLVEQIDDVVRSGFAHRVLVLDTVAARHGAECRAERAAMGRPVHDSDAQIAGICRSRGAALATRNVRDFEGLGIELIDPWAADA